MKNKSTGIVTKKLPFGVVKEEPKTTPYLGIRILTPPFVQFGKDVVMALKMIFDRGRVSIFSYQTVDTKLRYGNRIYSGPDRTERLHEGSDFMTQEEATQDAENYLTDNQISVEEEEEE